MNFREYLKESIKYEADDFIDIGEVFDWLSGYEVNTSKKQWLKMIDKLENFNISIDPDVDPEEDFPDSVFGELKAALGDKKFIKFIRSEMESD